MIASWDTFNLHPGFRPKMYAEMEKAAILPPSE
jgi:hypothetical protein